MHRWQDLDYLRTKDKIIYLVKGSHHDPACVRAYPVYWPDSGGERHHELYGSYHKYPSDHDNGRLYQLMPLYRPSKEPLSVPAVARENIVERYQPRSALERFLDDPDQQNSNWRQLYLSLREEAGVPQEMIGIIGSYLVGLHRDQKQDHIKDIDFVVYGLENMIRVKEHINQIHLRLHAQGISPDHVAYHSRKFAGILGSQTTLERALERKWPSLQLAPGLLATLRFVYQPEEAPPDPWSLSRTEDVVIRGEVVDATHAVFMPRRFTVQTVTAVYEIVIPYWGLYSCVRDGDRVTVGGALLSDQKTIALLGREHFLAIG